jgi:hypothetical protein
VWFVESVIVEMVDWDGDVVGWVEEGGVGVFAFDERIGSDCVSLEGKLVS